MKKSVLIAVLGAMTLVTASSFAQTGQGTGGGQAEPQFEQHKAQILQRISERLADLQKRQACVQAATNHQALHACMPRREEHEGAQGEQGTQGAPGAQGMPQHQ